MKSFKYSYKHTEQNIIIRITCAILPTTPTIFGILLASLLNLIPDKPTKDADKKNKTLITAAIPPSIGSGPEELNTANKEHNPKFIAVIQVSAIVKTLEFV